MEGERVVGAVEMCAGGYMAREVAIIVVGERQCRSSSLFDWRNTRIGFHDGLQRLEALARDFTI